MCYYKKGKDGKPYMEIGFTKTFVNSFNNYVEKYPVLGESIIETLYKIKENDQTGGLNFEFVKKTRFMSARVNRQYRIIFYRENNVAYMFYVDNHEPAYAWARSCKAIHYKKNLVGYWDSRVQTNSENKPSFDNGDFSCFDKAFQNRLVKCTSSEELKELCKGLPPEYREVVYSHNAVNNVAKNYTSEILVVKDDQDLEEAITKSFQEWTVFLHPIQKEIIEYPKNKNLIITGGPGTGKTVSLVHRLVSFLENKEKCLLISKTDATLQVVLDMVQVLNKNLKVDTKLMDEISEENIQILFKKYDYFFFDEFQDIGRGQCKMLYDEFLIRDKDKHFSIAYDLNQAIYTVKNRDEVTRFEIAADKVITLTYNYRCTEEIFTTAAAFIREQYDRVSQETILMDFGLTGNETDCFDFRYTEEIDTDLVDFVFEHNIIKSEDWAIIFVGYYDEFVYKEVKKVFPDNVFSVTESKGMDFKTGCVVIYNNNFDMGQRMSFREFNAQAYVGITRFRDSVTIFRVKERYEDTPMKNIANIHNNVLKKSKYDKNKNNKKIKKVGKARSEKRLALKIKENKDENTYE